MKPAIKMNRTSISRGAAALTVSAALLLGAPIANADVRTVIGTVDSQAIADIDASSTVDLTIIKTPPQKISGISFTVRKVKGVDLTTPAGWEAARRMSVGSAKIRGFDSEASATTDAEGKAYFKNLPIGLYLVSQQGTSASIGKEPAEFLITLPTGSDDGTYWNYDVEVFAKEEDKDKPPTPPVPTPTPPPVTSTPPAPPETPEVPTTTPGKGKPSKGLADTGANVTGLAALALFLIAGGVFFVFRKKRS
ncbi:MULTISPECIES: pilin N-terminal domain-containing protein [Corynebacterium]|uniref:pilin N-terminal domain-containing protein n=1 Tax=Corynebacterium TaxID=1716 RepID=UPI00257B46ED|nr:MULTISPECIES: pilin N-terminal domain-containing protein [Corynebacterium]